MENLSSIDVGNDNLGLSEVKFGDQSNPWKFDQVSFIEKVNLHNLKHERVKWKECKLHHTLHIVDLVDHFIQEYRVYLDRAKFILMEKQPPGGMTDIEALLYKEYREKMILMSPKTMHAFYKIGHLDYEGRKIAVSEIGEKMLKTNPEMLKKYQNLVRQHDIGDSLAYAKMWLLKQERQWDRLNPAEEEIEDEKERPVIDFKKYAYQPCKLQKQ